MDEICLSNERLEVRLDKKLMMKKQETMISRERVINTLNHIPVDRMPIDLGSHYSTGINAFAYWNLRKQLGMNTDNIWIPDTSQFLAKVDEDILERFHCDCILLHPGWPETRQWNIRDHYVFTIPATMEPSLNSNGDWVVERHFQDGGSGRKVMPKGGFFFDGDYLGKWVDESDDTLIARTAREAERIYKETSFATNYMGYGAYFGNIEQLIRMIQEPETVMEENEKALQNNIHHAGKVIDAMGKYIQLITINSDMGFQNATMCAPEIMEKCSAPYIKRFCDFVHANSDCKVFLHSCGSIKNFIPILIDCGVDVLNPVQISADNMDPRELKREFGERIIFWGGGCNTQFVLGTKTPEDVAANVQELVEIFKPGGNFVFNQVHNIMGNVPPENIITMFDTAYKNSFYDLKMTYS